MSILKIDASARLTDSNSRTLTQYLVEQLGDSVIERDLVKHPLPLISAQDLMGVHGSSSDSRESLQQHLSLSQQLVDELMAADTLVFGSPIYNFTVPGVLKQWIDYVCRAGVTFKYGEQGPVGLTGIKRAFIITSSGGVPVGSPMDHASRYLEQICKFIGVEEVIHIDASGSKGAPELIINEGKKQIDAALVNIKSVSTSEPA